MRTFTDDGLPLAVGVGIGIILATRGYSALETLGFVTVFYIIWKMILWRGM